jgi:uncharacterized protein YoaH (UPF0181 family)
MLAIRTVLQVRASSADSPPLVERGEGQRLDHLLHQGAVDRIAERRPAVMLTGRAIDLIAAERRRRARLVRNDLVVTPGYREICTQRDIEPELVRERLALPGADVRVGHVLDRSASNNI